MHNINYNDMFALYTHHFIMIHIWLAGPSKCCSPKAECYGIFAQYRFRRVLGELGRFREGTLFREPVLGSVSGTGSGKPGSGPEALFRVQKVASARFRRFRCSTCFEGLGSVPEVWTEPVREPGSGNPRY